MLIILTKNSIYFDTFLETRCNKGIKTNNQLINTCIKQQNCLSGLSW
ncbi:MAG: hypothetical protein UX90_C0002G0098 [Candidatus Wolfebacteria bacterium GW2011_GWD2_47_17]|nr:MAG: hypothetical protein UX90_C0002G0098 [Candidatus Wolfebacteria bacterium GW2011_GWD2_47_17]